jgi:hypothetical protein
MFTGLFDINSLGGIMDSQLVIHEKSKQFGYNALQIVLSVVVVTIAAVTLLVAYLMTTVPQLEYGSQFAALFSAWLTIALSGGLIPKCDVPIHTIAEELLLEEDKHEEMRDLFRYNFLNFVPDIFGLLPGLLIFILANSIIGYHWSLWALTPAVVIGFNIALLLVAIASIPIFCSLAHSEVQAQQLRWYDKWHSK